MNRQILKRGFLSFAAIISSFWVSFACSVSPYASREQRFIDSYTCTIPESISDISSVIVYDNFYSRFLDEQRNNWGNIFIPSRQQRAEFNRSFTGLIYHLWFDEGANTKVKLRASLQNVSSDMWQRYRDSSLSTTERTKFAYLYFLTQEVIRVFKGTNNTTQWTSNSFTYLDTYYTLNGRLYTIRQNNQIFSFSRGNSTNVVSERHARTLQWILNYLDYQNRLVFVAPNGKRYGIRRYNNYVKINRSNGTIINKDFPSVQAAQQMLETCAVNHSVARQYRQLCGFTH